MTIKLARITERDGLVFLCDKNGKELGQVVPKEPSEDAQWILTGCHDFDDTRDAYKAMLSAAKVDVSAASVKVPERRKPTMKNWGDAEMRGWNACLDELEGE